MISISQNHFIRFIQNINKTNATSIQVICPSHIALKDCSNQFFRAISIDLLSRNSSLIRSNIRIFASIAIPSERIKPAIEASVRTIQRDLTIARTMMI
jgi:intein-encoded DNA endonuclease-like protein